MKPSRIVLAALLPVAIFCCWLAVISWQQSQRSHIHVVNMNMPALSYRSAIGPNDAAQTGILSDPNFQKVLHALQKRTGVKTLVEPEATTISDGAVNGAYYSQTFTLPMTNR